MSIIDPHRPASLPSDDRARLRRAAFAAPALWPGAVGELVNRDLTAMADFGFRLDARGLTWRLVAAVEDEQRRQWEQSEQAWAVARHVGGTAVDADVFRRAAP